MQPQPRHAGFFPNTPPRVPNVGQRLFRIWVDEHMRVLPFRADLVEYIQRRIGQRDGPGLTKRRLTRKPETS